MIFSPLLFLACSIPFEKSVQMRWARATSTSWKYVLFDSAVMFIRFQYGIGPAEGMLTVDVVVGFHQGSMRLGDERLKKLSWTKWRFWSFWSENKTNGIEQSNLMSLSADHSWGQLCARLTCQTSGKFLRFTTMSITHMIFHMVEETNISVRISLAENEISKSPIATASIEAGARGIKCRLAARSAI